eukprot:4843924-Pleurochrysis_carterae.AAC.2
MGDPIAPRSAGCSRTYSAPESRAARSNQVVRRTSSFAAASSRAWRSGTLGRPTTLSRSRTGVVRRLERRAKRRSETQRTSNMGETRARLSSSRQRSAAGDVRRRRR